MNKRPWQTLCWHRAELISLASPPASAVSISIATAVTLPVTRSARAPHPPRGRNVTVASRQFSRSPGFRHCRSAAASLRDRRLCRLTVGTGASYRRAAWCNSHQAMSPGRGTASDRAGNNRPRRHSAVESARGGSSIDVDAPGRRSARGINASR